MYVNSQTCIDKEKGEFIKRTNASTSNTPIGNIQSRLQSKEQSLIKSCLLHQGEFSQVPFNSIQRLQYEVVEFERRTTKSDASTAELQKDMTAKFPVRK